jgi:hypothetical protein
MDQRYPDLADRLSPVDQDYSRWFVADLVPSLLYPQPHAVLGGS